MRLKAKAPAPLASSVVAALDRKYFAYAALLIYVINSVLTVR